MGNSGGIKEHVSNVLGEKFLIGIIQQSEFPDLTFNDFKPIRRGERLIGYKTFEKLTQNDLQEYYMVILPGERVYVPAVPIVTNDVNGNFIFDGKGIENCCLLVGEGRYTAFGEKGVVLYMSRFGKNPMRLDKIMADKEGIEPSEIAHQPIITLNGIPAHEYCAGKKGCLLKFYRNP